MKNGINFVSKFRKMKHLLPLLLSLLPLLAAAQICNIDYTQTQVGIYPDTLPSGSFWTNCPTSKFLRDLQSPSIPSDRSCLACDPCCNAVIVSRSQKNNTLRVRQVLMNNEFKIFPCCIYGTLRAVGIVRLGWMVGAAALRIECRRAS